MVLSYAGGASARTLTIRSFKAEITVTPDGMVDVTETIEAHFAGSWNGLYRTVPVEYTTAQGLNYSLFVDLLSATDDSGTKLKVETSRASGYLKFKIFVPGAQDATRTIVLHYRVSDALRFFEDHDELYWNVTGNDWDYPIENASAMVMLPPGTNGLHALAFTGSYGSKSRDAKVEVLGTLVNVDMLRTLEFHEGLTVVVGWDKGVVHPPAASETIFRFFRSNWPLGIPILAFVAMFYLWYTKGRDPRRNPISVKYEPPDGLTPGEVGTLVDNSADMRDVTATLVDLAVRGYLKIEQKETKHLMGLYSDKTYTFHRTKPPSEWATLKSHELNLLSAIFGNGAYDSAELSELQNHFYKSLPSIRNGLLDSMVEHGYYIHRPDNVRGGWIGAGVVVGVLMVLAGNALAASTGMAVIPFAASGILTALVIVVFGYFMPVHTSKGEQALEDALGFEDFLQHVESDRIERLQKTPELFEKFLPFAMALGVEKKWAGKFSDIYKQPPSWYQGGMYGPNFLVFGFMDDLNRLSVQASAAMISAPRSVSSGSGFGGGGGGGFSGGGFGGGGGGGF
jgi:uncharacterized membrane protein